MVLKKFCCAFLLLCSLFILSNSVLLADGVNALSVIEFKCSNDGVSLNNIEIHINFIETENNSVDEYSYINFASGFEYKLISTNSSGIAQSVLYLGNYSALVNMDSLPDGYSIETPYYEFSAGDNFTIELVESETNNDSYNDIMAINDYSVTEVSSEVILDLSYDELIDEFSTESVVYNNHFRIYYYQEEESLLNNNMITYEEAINLLDIFNDIREYFCEDNLFEEPYTEIINNNKVFHVFVYPLTNAAGICKHEGYSSYFCIDPESILSEAHLIDTSAHEYFHAVQHQYFYGTAYGGNVISYLSEGTASLAGHLFLINYGLDETVVNEMQTSIEGECSDFYENTRTGIFSAEDNKEYGSFLFHLFIYENFGGFGIMRYMFNLVDTISSNNDCDVMLLYCNSINDVLLPEEEYTCERLFDEFLDYVIHPTTKYDFNGYEYMLFNSHTEEEQPYEDLTDIIIEKENEFEKNKETDENVNKNKVNKNGFNNIVLDKYGFDVIRRDALPNSYCNYEIIIGFDYLSTDNNAPSIAELQEIVESSLRVKVYGVNSSNQFIEQNYQISFSETPAYRIHEEDQNRNSIDAAFKKILFRVNISLGNNTFNSFIFLLYNIGEEFSFEHYELINYRVIGDCLYKIRLKANFYYMKYYIDEINCVSDNSNIYLKDNFLYDPYPFDASYYFWIIKEGSYYKIYPYAEKYYDSTCENLIVRGDLSSNNVSIKCSTYSSYNFYWILQEHWMEREGGRVLFYTIAAVNNSNYYISAYNNRSGSNSNTTSTSNGNIILSSTSEYKYWRLEGVNI